MRFYTAAASFLSVSASLVAAADTVTAATSTTSSSSAGYSCAAQNIVDACLASTQPLMQACAANDWNCLCTQSINVLTCYNNCPGDPDQFGAQQTKVSYCNAAAAYGSSSSTITKVQTTATSGASQASTASTTTDASQATDSSAASTNGSDGSNGGSTSTSTSTGSKTSASTKAKSKNAAAGMTVESSSLVAALLIGLGAML